MHSDYRCFWGKAQPFDAFGPRWHPVAWHGLDVAAVLVELLANWPALRTCINSAFEEPSETIHGALLTLAAIHDIGKFARTFQAKVADHYPACLGAWKAAPPVNHAEAGLALLESESAAPSIQRTMQRILGPSYENQDRFFLLDPALGHHGRPVAYHHIDMSAHFEAPSRSAATSFLVDVYELFEAPSFPKLRKGAGPALSWRLAGLVALADWIGSDQEYFRYHPHDVALVDYWRNIAAPAAKRAVAASGLAPAAVSQGPSTHIVVPEAFRASLTDAQIWASKTSLPKRAGLFVIEDVMGSGKTEAALILAHRLMQAGRADGLYVALPTMATANALYERLRVLYRQLFAPDALPSLVLSHGARDLHDGFRHGIGLEAAGRIRSAHDAQEEDETASAACARWLADDRRKTFLAHVGVGTVDQALLAALPVKHAAVRQFGLARKVLIIDEAHAYDAYMQVEIEKLVEHQAMAGAPCIILSATLPMKTRRKFATAHAKGLGRPPSDLSSQAYPLATNIGDKTIETPLVVRPDLARNLTIARCADPAAAEANIIAAAAAGATVAYIRNTVDDAFDAALRLRAAGLMTDLFHARFAMHDRMRAESAVLARFGRKAAPDERRARVLVATQVVEQSLDLDFDLMITDLAPVDLMLQRAGRIWRHQRSGRGWGKPTLMIVSPEPDDGASSDWFAGIFPRGQWVYRNHALLWRSAKEILASSEIALPDDIRRLVETVYDDDLLNAAPAPLQPTAIDTLGKDSAARGQANLNVLKLERGYALNGGAWSSDIETPTRLADPRQRLRLARIERDRLIPWTPVEDKDDAKAWALSEVTIGKGWFSARAGLSAEIERQARQIDKDWVEKRIDAIALPLVEKDGAWTCDILDGRGGAMTLLYSPALGLRRSDRV